MAQVPPDVMQGTAVPPAAGPQIFASEPIPATAQMPFAPHVTSPAAQGIVMPQAAAGMPQTSAAPAQAAPQQVFASTPMPAAPQPYPVQQPFPGVAGGSELQPQPGTINFTQDGQGRNYNDRIMELYKSGKSNVAIARELNLGVGEVKLVIDLYKNRSEK